MRTFKKIIFSLIISLMIFTLVGCQSKVTIHLNIKVMIKASCNFIYAWIWWNQ